MFVVLYFVNMRNNLYSLSNKMNNRFLNDPSTRVICMGVSYIEPIVGINLFGRIEYFHKLWILFKICGILLF